ncbi:hypothetical protein NDU88_003601 [Pleurodeles waltl]|uniref:Uncharacterized protein n=1 Tax=Pleurodeles waltl TaxID=8319 RepID=A0AAV7TPJ1_PLEWA|nr:hypothetical protein NDU88_003601 [Pleurodeles waltl]
MPRPGTRPRAPNGPALRATGVPSPQGDPPPLRPARPTVPGDYPVAACGVRRLCRSRELESAALPVGGRLGAKSAVATPILQRRLPPVGGPLTLGRGRARRRRPPVTPPPMVLRAPCPAEEICSFPGLRVSQFREATGRLPEARIAPAVAEGEMMLCCDFMLEPYFARGAEGEFDNRQLLVAERAVVRVVCCLHL